MTSVLYGIAAIHHACCVVLHVCCAVLYCAQCAVHAVLCMLCSACLCCACCVVLCCAVRCCACCAVLPNLTLCCACYPAERKESIQSGTYLMQLYYCRSLNEGFRVSYINTILLGVKGSKVPHYLPSMEDPDIIIMPLAHCTDLAKSC